MRMHSSYGYMKQWICTAVLMIPILFSKIISSTSYCQSCRDCDDIHEALCFCRITTLYRMEQRWNNWNGRYDLYQGGKKYSFLTCENMRQDSVLGYDICPENDCKYITFLRSDIKAVMVNSFVDISHIEELYLNSSGIQQIQLGAFSGISKLQILHLEDNKIAKISKGYLNSLISLKILDLHRNAITSIEDESFIGLTMLETLDLSQNALKNVPLDLFDPLENLKKLNLSNNFLTIIDFKLSHLQKLGTLDLSSNKIEVIEECFNESNVISIYLQDNQISYLNDSCFPASLTSLYIGNNNITELQNEVLENLGELSILDLSQNQIKRLSIELFKDCRHLQELDISHNEIDHLKIGVFSGVPALTFLNISYIKIKTLDPHTFIPLTHLKTFDFDHNDLDDLDASIFNYFHNLEEIYISVNYLSCSVVASIISQSKMKNFSVVYDKDFATENVNGLPCKKMHDTSAQHNMDNSDERYKGKLINDGWEMREKEMMENISSKLRSNLKELIDSEKISFQNILNEFSSKQEFAFQEYQGVLETEKLDMKKYINELFSKHSLNRNVATNSANSELLHEKIEKHFDAQNTKIEDSFITFSKDLEKVIEKSVPSIESSAINSVKNLFNSSKSSSMLKGNFETNNENSTTKNLIQNLSTSLNELKIILVIIFSICVFFFVIGKVSVKFCRRFRNDKDSFDLTHEIPILRNY